MLATADTIATRRPWLPGSGRSASGTTVPAPDPSASPPGRVPAPPRTAARRRPGPVRADQPGRCRGSRVEPTGFRHPDVEPDPDLRAVRLPAADRVHGAGPDARPGDPGRRGRAGQDHRGRSGAVRATAARAGATRPRGHPGGSGRPVAGGARTQVRPADDRSAARRMGKLRRIAGRGRLDRHRPPGSDQVGAAGRAVGSDRRGRGSSAAEPAVGLGPVRPRTHVPLSAAADRDAGGEPALRPLRTDQPGRSRAARHSRGLPPDLRRGRHSRPNRGGCRSCAARYPR